MDLSKLPKLSESPAPPPNAGSERSEDLDYPRAQYQYVESPRRAGAAEAWISIAIGALLLLMTPTTLQYFFSKIFGTTFAPFPDPTQPPPAKCDFIMYTDGTKIFYRDMLQFWSDLAVTAFALVLIVDGVVLLLARNRTFVALAFVLTVLATGGNLIYLVTTFSQGVAIVSALAVIFGAYIAYYQWTLLQSLLSSRRSV